MSNKCSFCGLEKHHKDLIEGLEGNVCLDCIETINKQQVLDMITESGLKVSFKPHELKEKLDEYIIGQDEAKKKLVVEVYNHFKRIQFKDEKHIELPKSNILLIGPSGSGKTYLLEKLSTILNIPLAIGDATSLTANGYAGKDVESLLLTLVRKANGDISQAEKGIIYIDEIDKIVAKNENKNVKDVGGEAVQQTLLKIIEGTEYTFDKSDKKIDTSNILFICGGAFDGLQDVINKRHHKSKKIGFSTETNEFSKEESVKLNNVLIDDLIHYGLIREFVGRLQTIAVLDELTENDLKDILIKPKNSIITQYKTLFKMDGVNLEFSQDAIDYIANQAKERAVGARGLKSIIADKLNDLMYDLPMQEEVEEFTVTKEYLIN